MKNVPFGQVFQELFMEYIEAFYKDQVDHFQELFDIGINTNSLREICFLLNPLKQDPISSEPSNYTALQEAKESERLKQKTILYNKFCHLGYSSIYESCENIQV